MHRRSMLVSALVVAVVGLSGCASKEDATDDPSTGTPTNTTSSIATSEPTDAGQVIDIAIKGEAVSPNGKKVDVKANEPVILNITADQPGEIHIHSAPELEIEYEAGESTHTLTFNRPGVVEVESHTLEKVIVQLQVR